MTNSTAHNDEQVIYLNKNDLVFNKVEAPKSEVTKTVINLVNNSMEAEVSLSPTIFIPLISNNDGTFKVRTLLDPGSGTNWIVVSLLKFVKHTVKGSETLEVVTFSGSIRKRFPLVELLYKLPNGKAANIMCYVNDNYTRHIAPKGMLDYIIKKAKTKHSIFSNLVDPASLEADHGRDNQGIGLILCSSSINKLRTSEGIIPIPELDILLEPTIFGVAISGAIPSSLRHPDNIIMANNIAPKLIGNHQDPRLFLAKEEVTLPEDVDFMWGQETLGIQPEELHEDHRMAWESFLQNISRDPSTGQYTVGLPWNSKKYLLRDNKSVAAGRTYAQRDIMIADQEYGNLMIQAKRELLDKDYIERVETDAPTNNLVYYMPYRGIIKQDSDTTKCRLVMDASSKPSASHISLNQALYQGPNLVVELAFLLLRFMLGVFGSISDIEKAFLRILISECDRDALRFFWFEDPLDPYSRLNTFRFKAVMFGSAASPFQLAAVLQTLINDDCHNVQVKKALEDGIYVDNIIHATDSEEELMIFFEVSRQVLANGSFNLRQWASNSPKLMTKAKSLNIEDNNIIVKVLGLYWDIDRDRYLYNTNFEWDGKFTKRSALRYTNKVFDPLGWLIPMSIRRRLFVQKLWDKELKWEDSFEFVDDFAKQWLQLVKETHIAVTSSKVRRAVFTTNSELHIFSDASKEAYGAVVYVRTPPSQEDPQGTVQLVSAKGKVTSKKGICTIPRFELSGVVVAGHQVPYIRKAWNLPDTIQVNLWCDARVVLNWLSQYEIKETFIHNRVVQVRELCEPTQNTTTIRYVPSELNPADILTKEHKAQDFVENSTWWQGPSWLLNEQEWPTSEEYNLYPGSWKRVQMFATANIKVGDTSVISFFNKANFEAGLRKMVYVLRAFHFRPRQHAFQGTNFHIDHMAKEELDHAKLEAVKIMQRDMFSEELAALKSGQEITSGSCKKLNIHLDSDGVIRCQGRLENSLEPTINTKQILVNGYHPFVQSYIRYKHVHLNCSSKQYTLHKVRKELAGPYLTVNVNKIVRECNACRILRARPYSYPKMPPLPRTRLAAERPFAVCGVDYSGPHYVKQGRSSVKVWIALFTCMVSRAIHLELVPDLKAETFLQALKCLSWRKGTPRVIMSDNATNFTKSSKLLKELSESNAIKSELGTQGIKWLFTPAYAPHFGAVYERLVGVLKKELVKLIGQSQLSFHELHTQLVEIEGIINSRPLTQVGNLEVITPMNILTGRDDHNEDILNVLDTQEIMREAEEARFTLPQMFQATAKRKANFWHSFQNQYLESIKFAGDVSQKKNSGLIPKIGDLVIIHSKDPRLQWRKAIILEVFPSTDGQLRKCRVKTSTGQSIRATKDLYPLELNTEMYIDLYKFNKRADENDFEGFDNPQPPDRAQLALELLGSLKDNSEIDTQ